MNHVQDLQSLNPDLTPEVISRVEEVVARYDGKPGCLIPVLEECQEIAGYLPQELQDYIARELNIPGSTVYGVVTFYSFFSMVPKGRHTIKVCLGTACYVRGIAEVLDRLKSEFKLGVGGITEDRRFSLEAVRCLGACGLAPVVVVDDNTHGRVGPNDIIDILNQYD
ncbi:MAG: NAD(P)H-dependent oxidoreductase subunit E [Deltaproteobacteria bacterium]|nr:NAD(P)H-dependent oxidoreductase subunit E [Deltaproteobacteria bacterium]